MEVETATWQIWAPYTSESIGKKCIEIQLLKGNIHSQGREDYACNPGDALEHI